MDPEVLVETVGTLRGVRLKRKKLGLGEWAESQNQLVRKDRCEHLAQWCI
jgi:hypothetical protein